MRPGRGRRRESSELLVAEGFQVNVAMLPAGRGSRHLHPEAGRGGVSGAAAAVAAVSGLPARPGGGGASIWHGTRTAGVSGQMLAVAARIPDAAARDQFADRLAHKARITEEVVRAEIRKAAVQTADQLPTRWPTGRAAGPGQDRRTGPDLGAGPRSGRRPGGAGGAGSGRPGRAGDRAHPGAGAIPAGMARGAYRRRFWSV